MKSAKFWNLQNISSIKQQRISKDYRMDDSPKPWIIVIWDRITYLKCDDIDDALIRSSVLNSEPDYFWTNQRRLLLELILAEYDYRTEAGRGRRDIPFP